MCGCLTCLPQEDYCEQGLRGILNSLEKQAKISLDASEERFLTLFSIEIVCFYWSVKSEKKKPKDWKLEQQQQQKN